MSFVYKSNFPQNQKASYNEFDSIDFLLAGQDSVVLNSIRLEGVLTVQQSGAGLGTEKIRIDGMVGAHGLFESMTVETQTTGVIENIDAYPRMVKMMRVPEIRKDDLMSSKHVPELCVPNDYMTTQVLQGVIPMNSLKNAPVNSSFQPIAPDFSVMPMICLNRASTTDGSVPLLDLGKVGYLKLNVKLARVYEFLYGEQVDSNTSYSISDLKITYRSVMSGQSKPVQMRTISTFKSAVQSNLNNISARVPAIADSVLISFIQQAREQTAEYNNVALEEIPNIKFVDFVYNDNTNQIVSYQVKDRSELLDRAMDALRATGKHSANVKTLKANECFMLGINFNQFINWANNKLSINMSSDVQSSTPYAMYFMFNGLQEL